MKPNLSNTLLKMCHLLGASSIAKGTKNLCRIRLYRWIILIMIVCFQMISYENIQQNTITNLFAITCPQC